MRRERERGRCRCEGVPSPSRIRLRIRPRCDASSPRRACWEKDEGASQFHPVGPAAVGFGYPQVTNAGLAETQTGWVVGGGTGYKITPVLAAKAEYQYFDSMLQLPPGLGPLGLGTGERTQFGTFRVGANYFISGFDPLNLKTAVEPGPAGKMQVGISCSGVLLAHPAGDAQAVMAGPDPAIHAARNSLRFQRLAWMAGSSPAMTAADVLPLQLPFLG